MTSTVKSKFCYFGVTTKALRKYMKIRLSDDMASKL